MQKQGLIGEWQFRQCGTNEWLPAIVPGGVHTDLLALGKIPDPFVADNELKVMWVAENDWEYRHSFTVDANLLAEENVSLICDGLDTIADVYLNGIYLGHAENMFRRWEWKVGTLLQEGSNELRIIFGSPIRFITAKQAQFPLQGGGDIPGGPHLRKAPCHWGWDWGPKLPPIGIWKDVRLEGFSARFTNVHLRQQHNQDGSVTIAADIEAESKSTSALTASLKIIAPDGQEWLVEESLFSIHVDDDEKIGHLNSEIKNPQLWWPNGYGAQPLYEVEVTLREGEKLLDQRNYKIGLRRLELCQDPDQWGKEFTFYINGVRLFAKGADWIPTDSLPTRITRSMLEGLLKSAVDANMNMLRVWGGGYYPEDMFYDLCDRFGILLWQDFMFACGIYPADTDFFENVRVEAVENVRRLRHHAALALWCGNNEMEQGWCDWGWNKPEDPLNQRLKDGYDRMFHQILPELLNEEDPDHAYWPSSASANTPFEGANNQVQGDCHYWDVWHGRKPFTAYRTQYPRFMSEFGFQALPPLKTIATYAVPSDWNMTSYIMEHHQRSGSGNGLMLAQMTDTFRMPKDFPALVYLSLLLQAEGIRYGVEHWRRNRARVSGTLIWQLNDCWPVASWASLDYFGRWKALHYAAKRFYAPLLLSVADRGKTMEVHITSDLVTPVDVLVRWRLETLDGKSLSSGEQSLRAMALADTLVGSYDFSALVSIQNQRKVVFVAEMWQAGKLISQSVTSFVANKHLELRKPGLKVQSCAEDKTLCIDVSARSLARFVELSIDGMDAVFSDNYFDIPAGTTVTVTTSLPENWTTESAVQARSLYDSFA
ncbi:MAG TPA: glycoside hydrolase family 2 protein [Anaerolineales bacterium]|nr:glycoside hydrolase family 2 protein [Anaerolineales bacterium]